MIIDRTIVDKRANPSDRNSVAERAMNKNGNIYRKRATIKN